MTLTKRFSDWFSESYILGVVAIILVFFFPNIMKEVMNEEEERRAERWKLIFTIGFASFLICLILAYAPR